MSHHVALRLEAMGVGTHPSSRPSFSRSCARVACKSASFSLSCPHLLLLLLLLLLRRVLLPLLPLLRRRVLLLLLDLIQFQFIILVDLIQFQFQLLPTESEIQRVLHVYQCEHDLQGHVALLLLQRVPTITLGVQALQQAVAQPLVAGVLPLQLRLHLLHVRAQIRRIPVYSGRVRHPPSSAARKIRGAGTQPPGCQAPDHARRVGNTDEMTEGRARVASRCAAAGGDGWGCAPLQQAELLAELRSGGLQVVELFVELPPERLALLQRHLQVVALRLLLLL